jgi:hypothetical protein
MADLPLPRPPLDDRFWSKVRKTETCWLWTGGTSGNGYGKFAVRRVSFRAHRLAWEEANGPIPDGLQLDHLCRVKLCVRPSHLEPVTGTVNIRRAFGDTCRLGHPYVQNKRRRRCQVCSRERNRQGRAEGRWR